MDLEDAMTAAEGVPPAQRSRCVNCAGKHPAWLVRAKDAWAERQKSTEQQETEALRLRNGQATKRRRVEPAEEVRPVRRPRGRLPASSAPARSEPGCLQPLTVF